ncbi:MAG: Nucleoside ABC transporter, permease protein 1, partial [uncultured Frankineae bacterium]
APLGPARRRARARRAAARDRLLAGDRLARAHRRRRPGVVDVRAAARLRPAPAQHHPRAERRHDLLPVGAGRGHRLPHEPVQHRGGRPVPPRGHERRLGRRGGQPADRSAPAGHRAGRRLRGRHVGGPGRTAQGHPRRERGHLDDHAERHRDRSGGVLPARGGRPGRRQQQHRHAPPRRVGPAGRAASRAGLPAGRLRLPAGRGPRRTGLLARARPHPLRLRAARDGPVGVRSGRERCGRAADGGHDDAAVRRGGRPGRHAAAARRLVLLQPRLPGRARLHRHRDRPARAQPPGRHRARRAAVGLSRRLLGDPRHRGHLAGDRHDHAGVDRARRRRRLRARAPLPAAVRAVTGRPCAGRDAAPDAGVGM